MMQRVLVLSGIGLGVLGMLSGCASAEEERDVAASQSQPLCPRGGCEPPEPPEGPPPPTFDCPVGQTFDDGSYYVVDGDQCVHYVQHRRGPSGGYYATTYNPCPYVAPHYTCTWYGSCQCY